MRIVVIGAGLAGMSTAIRLAAEKHEVIIVEKGERVGGKLNFREGNGFHFDTGPSIITMPWVLEKLFADAGKKLSDYLEIVRVQPEWRAFWEDGSQLDMRADLVDMMDTLYRFAPDDADHFLRYLDQARSLYRLTEKGFYRQSIRDLSDLRKLHSLRELMAMSPMKTVHQTTASYFSNPKIQQLFDFLVMYVGSSPYEAPAILTQLAHVQLGLGVWYISGGLYNIARAEERLLHELGATFLMNAKVQRINTSNGIAKGVTLEDGRVIEADLVVCNLEVTTAWRTLLSEDSSQQEALNKGEKFSPSVSGLVLLLGLDRTYPQLAHHNFFFSADPMKEFHQMFAEGVPADDPTIYIGVSARTDPTQAPAGKDNLFILTHVPPLKVGDRWEPHRDRYKRLVMDKLERNGLEGLQHHVEWSYEFTPDDLYQLYGANGGSIYGVVSDRKKNGGFKHSNLSQEVKNLYFVGGSSHPGGGVPMVTLSGILTANMILGK